MIRIDSQACIGCGACARDCPMGFIHMRDNKAQMTEPYCIDCGHCFALCPVKAVAIEGYTEADYAQCVELTDIVRGESGTKRTEKLDPETLLLAMKSRRSIRRFTGQRVEAEKLEKLIEAVRYAPTGRNTQQVRVTLVQEKLPELTARVSDVLAELPDHLPEDAPAELREMADLYRERWKIMRDRYRETGRDGVFHNASAVLVLSGRVDVDAAIAAAYAELLVHAMGLGCVYVGFLRLAAEDASVRTMLGIRKGYQVVCTLAIGYPDVAYRRTVPRKEKKVVRL